MILPVVIVSKESSMQLLIDVVGGCNLKCPSCPVGNMDKSEGGVSGGIMKMDLAERIIDKAVSEINDLEFIALYNWTEPLLHPNLPQLISMIKSKSTPVHLSSNLNILKNPDELMESNPDYFRVSLSGFEQGTYSISHKGGDVSVVKKNMMALMESKLKMNADTVMTVLFHKYIGNKDDEEKMRSFAESIGYRFETAWAYLMPLEKMFAYVGDNDSGTSLREQDWEVIDNFALTPSEAVLIARKYAHRPCWLNENQITLDPGGNVVLCCGIYDQKNSMLGHFLDLSIDKIEFLKKSGKSLKTCTKCMNNGLHVLALYGASEFNELAEINVRNN